MSSKLAKCRFNSFVFEPTSIHSSMVLSLLQTARMKGFDAVKAFYNASSRSGGELYPAARRHP